MNKTILLLIVILATASFLRIWQLDSIPPGLYPDEAINAIQGWEAAEKGNYKVFYPDNHGREGLFINLLGLSLTNLKPSLFSLRLIPAIFGILTVLGIFLLTKELLKPITKHHDYLALISSFLLATSFWHINFSRIVFRAIMTPFALVFAFYFILKGFREKSLKSLALGGIFYGIGFHTYISFRLSVLFFALTLLLWLIVYIKDLKKFFILSLALLIFITIVALPIGLYFIENPEYFASRATPISVFAKDNPVKAFTGSFFMHMGMFNFYGDPNWRHNFSGSPMLPLFLGLFFLIGLIFSIKEFFLTIKKKELKELITYSLILSWFLIMMLPGMLTFEGIPHALRVIGVIPIAYIITTIGIWRVCLILKNKLNKKLIPILLIVLIIFTFSFEANKYFFKWAKNPEVKSAFTERFVKIANYLNSLPESANTYVIANEGDLPINTIYFFEKAKGRKSNYIFPNELNRIERKPNTTIIVTAFDENIKRELENMFPKGYFSAENGINIYRIK